MECCEEARIREPRDVSRTVERVRLYKATRPLSISSPRDSVLYWHARQMFCRDQVKTRAIGPTRWERHGVMFSLSTSIEPGRQ